MEDKDFIREFSKRDWVWLLSLIVRYQENNEEDDAAIQFWNWCIDFYKPEGFDKTE